MRNRISALLGALAALSMLAVSACGATAAKQTGAGASAAGEPVSGLRIMVPNAPGGGYDTTARTAAKVMEDTKIASGVQVFNLPGAGGTVGLQRTINEKGNGKLAMLMGLGVVGASYASKSTATLTQTTPIAKLIEEAGAIVVSKDSQPFDLVLLLVLGLLGFGMRRFGLPVLPLIVGVILGPRAELQGRRSLQLSGGDLSGLLGGPVSYTVYAVILILLAWPLIRRFVRKSA
ncbi:hypothetical protein [Nonomuraea sp. JJY05]|uniref:hypothetical protein n=1 Tax=Nonomuraea sp. JJY05 TaxID=3350255 RepID=UPI00373F6366